MTYNDKEDELFNNLTMRKTQVLRRDNIENVRNIMLWQLSRFASF